MHACGLFYLHVRWAGRPCMYVYVYVFMLHGGLEARSTLYLVPSLWRGSCTLDQTAVDCGRSTQLACSTDL